MRRIDPACRPRLADDRTAGSVAMREAGDPPQPQPAPREQRQPVLGEPIRDGEAASAAPGSLRRHGGFTRKRFVRGRPTVSRPPVAVWINPPEQEGAEEILRQRGILPAECQVLAQ